MRVMIRCDFVEDSKGKKITIAKFVEEGSDIRSIWEKCLINHAFSLIRNCKLILMDSKIYDLVYEVLEDRKLVGIAKLHDGDEYDQKMGIKLARQDLKDRYEKAELLLEKLMYQEIEKQLKQIKASSKHL